MMKKPKVEKINLPYASSVASFYGDQGAAQGNSFLGRMFQGTGRTRMNKVFSTPSVPKKGFTPTLPSGVVMPAIPTVPKKSGV
jgi:hypothetical protein